MNPFVYSAGIGFGGALMFFFFNKYEPDGPMSRLLRFLVPLVGALAILHKLKPYGFSFLARASARGFNGKSQHHYIKRFRISAALTDALDITHAPVFAKYLHAGVSDRCDVNEHVLTAVIRLYKAVALIPSVEFDFSRRYNPILAKNQNGCLNNNTTTNSARVTILLTTMVTAMPARDPAKANDWP